MLSTVTVKVKIKVKTEFLLFAFFLQNFQDNVRITYMRTQQSEFIVSFV